MSCLQADKLELINLILNDDDAAVFLIDTLRAQQGSGPQEEELVEEEENPFRQGSARTAVFWGG